MCDEGQEELYCPKSRANSTFSSSSLPRQSNSVFAPCSRSMLFDHVLPSAAISARKRFSEHYHHCVSDQHQHQDDEHLSDITKYSHQHSFLHMPQECLLKTSRGGECCVLDLTPPPPPPVPPLVPPLVPPPPSRVRQVLLRLLYYLRSKPDQCSSKCCTRLSKQSQSEDIVEDQDVTILPSARVEVTSDVFDHHVATKHTVVDTTSLNPSTASCTGSRCLVCVAVLLSCVLMAVTMLLLMSPHWKWPVWQPQFLSSSSSVEEAGVGVHDDGDDVASVILLDSETVNSRTLLNSVTRVIDGHNDLPWNIRKFVQNELKTFNFDSDLRHVTPWNSSRWSHTDLPRLRQGHVGAQFFAAYVPCDSQWKDAVQMTLEQIDIIVRLTAAHQSTMLLATSSSEIETALASGRVASLIGVEGGHSIGNSLAVLRTLYNCGARYLTLTHTCNTPWASSSVSDDNQPSTSDQQGLTNFGTAVIVEMNRLGMMIDLSHTSEKTAEHVLARSRAPVLFSHSAAAALCNISRNVPDYLLRRVKQNGGIVMVSFYSKLLTCTEYSTVDDVIEHINHIRKVAGVDHVGIGAGFDGIDSTPRGLDDVSRYPYLFERLSKVPGWTRRDIAKLASLNLLRVFRKVEEVARGISDVTSGDVTRDDVTRGGAGETRIDPRLLLYSPEAVQCSYELSEAMRRRRGRQLYDGGATSHATNHATTTSDEL